MFCLNASPSWTGRGSRNATLLVLSRTLRAMYSLHCFHLCTSFCVVTQSGIANRLSRVARFLVKNSYPLWWKRWELNPHHGYSFAGFTTMINLSPPFEADTRLPDTYPQELQSIYTPTLYHHCYVLL